MASEVDAAAVLLIVTTAAVPDLPCRLPHGGVGLQAICERVEGEEGDQAKENEVLSYLYAALHMSVHTSLRMSIHMSKHSTQSWHVNGHVHAYVFHGCRLSVHCIVWLCV